MSKVSNVERKGQYIINRFVLHGISNIFDAIHTMPNFDLDNILKEFRDYLIAKGVCPSCYNDLNEPDAQNEDLHCHSCKWTQSEHLIYTK